ncbi:hypothetical protein IWX50DRAFT_559608 [Phyllosticta citricarpa]
MSASAKDRRLQLSSEFYSELEKSGHKNLIRECPGCRRFFLDYGGVIFKDPLLCHDWAVIFTDGACPGNGSEFARAGIGIAAGEEEFRQLSVPWNSIDAVLKSVRRTNQQAELFAGMAGLKKGSDVHVQHLNGATKTSVVIATDSKNVVDGLTEWLPRWEVHQTCPIIVSQMQKLIGKQTNGYSTSSGGPVMNIRLFQCLQKRVIECEEENYIDIVFLHVPHEVNRLACGLSNSAAKMDVPGSFRGVAVEEEKRKTLRSAAAEQKISREHSKKIHRAPEHAQDKE